MSVITPVEATGVVPDITGLAALGKAELNPLPSQ
jgi:hypothetical protein